MPNEAMPWQCMPSDRSIVTCIDTVLPAGPSNVGESLKTEKPTIVQVALERGRKGGRQIAHSAVFMGKATAAQHGDGVESAQVKER